MASDHTVEKAQELLSFETRKREALTDLEQVWREIQRKHGLRVYRAQFFASPTMEKPAHIALEAHDQARAVAV